MYRYGVSPNKLFDYLAAGKPILSLIQSSYDLVEQYHLGVVVENQTEAEIKKAIISLLDMAAEEREQIGKRAREIAQKFDYRILAEKLSDIIDRILVTGT